MAAGGGAKGNEVELMDWERYLQVVVQNILEEQSPQALLTIRGKYYELLARLIPAQVILKELVKQLVVQCGVRAQQMGTTSATRLLQMETVCWGATYEQKMRQGGKEIVFLEAFTARFMSLYKQALMKRCRVCGSNNEMAQENYPTYALFTLALMEIQRRKGRPITTKQAAPMIKYSFYLSSSPRTPHQEGACQTVVVSLLQNGQRADGGGHAAGLRHFHVVLVVGVLVHGAHGLEVTSLAGSGSHVLLHLLTTTHYRSRGFRTQEAR